mmetsp:Transcript_39349/g.47690  ORF Transcript_39349/g.47690 Transcript_39349/m.47690 type:complete len:270 (+) Transcript_39349:112-921(+)|eukprot:CAMPEP_0197860326 /NCGR_PEP_ID=MMETSP1438-20131217/35600_1 /TAXON_ID=1461541 /ORGANISM="Pterosperma sp., Strain CCMP1384" /LENGTH=269 /DNA_ID=CAMNT_0043477137 /DNA_START=111 /DNA_END=920 /DNA_ORIENTATION=+
MGVPSFSLAVTKSSDAAGYLYEMGSIINSTKRRTTPVMFMMKTDDETVLCLEMADSQVMMDDAAKITAHPKAQSCLNLTTKSDVYTAGGDDALKALYDSATKSKTFSVKHFGDAGGYFKTVCKGVTLYYLKLTKYKLKEGNLSEFQTYLQEVTTHYKEIGFTSFMTVAADDTTVYAVEIGTPQLWMQHLKKTKADKAYNANIQASQKLLDSTDHYYYGNITDMMMTVNSAQVRASMFGGFGGPTAAPAATSGPVVTAKNLDEIEVMGWF